jgi:type I restriction-modification system DNA methylase subunit
MQSDNDLKSSETFTENIFRGYYGVGTFIEKSAIPDSYGFQSKNNPEFKGYPDFFLDDTENSNIVYVVEAKPTKHSVAENEVKFYMKNNKIKSDIVGIAISGQRKNQLKVTYYLLAKGDEKIQTFNVKDKLLQLQSIKKIVDRRRYGDIVTDDELIKVLHQLNSKFHANNKIRDTDRSLFFSGILIALTDNTFRNTFEGIQEPNESDVVLNDSDNMHTAVLNAINAQLSLKINSLSKRVDWNDQFAFIKSIDFSLSEYKDIIKTVRDKVYVPYKNEQKQDILGKAYKIFLSRSGRAEGKNIILTPDHIKSLMIKLARLEANDVVIDTCTGTGGFLMDAMEMMLSLADEDSETEKHIKNEQLIGFETDRVLFSLACSNMFLHGDGRSNMLLRSSLLNDAEETLVNSSDGDLLEWIKSKKPTKCIINPPYENNSSIKFVKQALEYLEPNGKLIIIMPTPTLTRNQGKDKLTEAILKIGKLDFVIKMPYTLFSEQGRTVNTSIFGFTKTPHHKSDSVFFYNLESDGFVSVQHKGRIDKYNLWNDIEGDIIEKTNDLEDEEGVSKKKRIYRGNELRCYGFEESRQGSTLVEFGELFSGIKGSLASESSDSSGEYDFITASDEWKKHSKYTHDTEALVYAVSAAGSLGKSQYVNGKFIASNLCLILTPKDDTRYPINLKFYNYYLNAIRKQIVVDISDGTSKLTINRAELERYYIEYFPIEVQNTFVAKHIMPIEQKRKELLNVLAEIDRSLRLLPSQ